MNNQNAAPQQRGIEQLARTLHAAAAGFRRSAEREGPRSPNHLIGFTVQLLAHRLDRVEFSIASAQHEALGPGSSDEPIVLLGSAHQHARTLAETGDLPDDLVGELDTLLREARGCARA